MKEPWHRGSRFWRALPWLIIVSAGMAIYFKESNLFLTPFMILVAGAAGKTNIDQYNQGREVS